MKYPQDFTADNIMEFEYEYNRLLDREQGLDFWSVNDELQEIAEQDRLALVDSWEV